MNFKNRFATVLLVLFSLGFTLKAQLRLNGLVLSYEQKPIPFSVVGLKNTFLSTQTNSEGFFEFNNLQPGQYVLLTKSLGYKTKLDTVLLDENKTVTISLTEGNVALDEIVVNATRADQNAAFAHNTISSEDVKKQNIGQDLPYAINAMPSVVINSDAGNGIGYTGMRIRGTDGTRINVTINGVPVNDAESHATFFVNMPDLLSSTHNIQVQRGVGTSANGAGAFGASINMQTNQLNEKPYAQANNSIGSFHTIKNTISAGTGLINQHFTFDARVSRINSDGYIDRAFSKLNSMYISAGYYSKKTILKAMLFSGWEKTYQAWNYVLKDSIDNGNRTFNSCGMFYDANGNITYYDNETDNYKQDNYQFHIVHSFNNKLTANLTGHYTSGKGYYEQYKQAQVLSKYNIPNIVITPDTTITNSDMITRRWLDNDFIGALGNITYKPSATWQFILGGGYNTYFGKHYGEVIWSQYSSPYNYRPRYYDDNATKRDGNAYLKTTIKPTDQLTVFLDAQYRTIYYAFMGFDTSLVTTQPLNASYGFFNPKAGINYLINSHTSVYASYGVANKEPNRGDFTQSSKLSRPRPERLLDLEIGASHRMKHASVILNLYNMQYQHQLVLNGQINDVGAYNRVNVDNSYRRGIEVELNANISKYLTFNGNLTLSQNKIKTFNEYIDSSDAKQTIYTQYKKKHTLTDISFSPNAIAAANFLIKPIPNFEIGFLNKYVSKQYLDNTSDHERAIHDYLVTDLRINYTVYTKLIKEIHIMAMVYNLFNTNYETNGYNYSFYLDDKLYKQNYLAPAAPTHFMVALNLSF